MRHLHAEALDVYDWRMNSRLCVVPAAVLLLLVPRVLWAQPGASPSPPPEPTSEPVAEPAAESGAPSPPPAEPPVVIGTPPPPPPPPPMMVARAAPVLPPPSTVDEGVLEDASSGRNWLTPTALTPPAGTFTISDFELFVLGASYSVTDQFQISGATLLPIVSDMPFVGILSAKLQVLRVGRVRAAGQLSAIYLRTRDGSSDRQDSAVAFTGGGALTLCLDVGCNSYASGYLGAGFARDNNSSVPIGVSATVVGRVARHVKLMLELDTGGVVGQLDAAADGVLAWYGVRFTSPNIGVDLGFVKPVCGGGCEIKELPLGLPFVAVSYRAL